MDYSLEGFENRGFGFLETNKFEIALRTFTEGLKFYPDSAELKNGLGQAYLELEDFSMAKVCFQEGLDLEPQNHEIKISLGISLLNFGKIDEAMKIFNEILQEVEKEFVFDYALMAGRALCNYNYFLEALKFFNLSLKLEPENYEANFGVGVCRHVLEMVNSKDFLWKAIKQNKECYDAISFLANIYFEEGRKKLALELFDKIPLEADWDAVSLKRVIRAKRKENKDTFFFELKLTEILGTQITFNELIERLKEG
ncbi:hypothetical protein IT568_00180 [bacterium]|nr:hypothetical protein [bacterium]